MAWLRERGRACEAEGRSEEALECLMWLGWFAGQSGDEEGAHTHLRAATALARRDPATADRWAGRLAVVAAEIDTDHGHHARALATCRTLLERGRTGGDEALTRHALFWSATGLGHLGEHDRAVEAFEEARQLLLSRPDALAPPDRQVALGRYEAGQAQVWLMRAGLLLEAGAEEAARDAMARARRLGEAACEGLVEASPRFSQAALFCLVRVLLEADEPVLARQWLLRVQAGGGAAGRPAPDSLAMAQGRLSEALVDLRTGDAEPALVLDRLDALEAIAHPRVRQGDLLLAWLRCRFEALEKAGRYEEALHTQRRWVDAKARLRARLAREHGRWTEETMAAWRAEAQAVIRTVVRAPLEQAARQLHALAQAPGDAGPADRTAVQRASHSVQRAVDIADQYLGVIRAERLRPEDLSVLDLAALVDDVCEQMAPPPGSSVRLERRLHRPTFVRGDTALLMRALGNLMSNAFKHAPAGTAVTVTLASVEPAVLLSVSDQGPGLALDMRARLFQRFSTSAVRKGNGLGLAMVARAARVHGARIEVDSEPGCGTTVRLLLEAVPHGG